MLIRSLMIVAGGIANAACATPETGETDCADTPCAAIGEPFASNVATITALEVLENSRCPIEAECIQAGQVRIRALVERDGREREVELATGEPVEVLSGTLTLVQVWPDMSIEHPISGPQAYRFNFTWAPHMLDRLY